LFGDIVEEQEKAEEVGGGASYSAYAVY